ncbi:MAG: NAD(P)H-quinone oxidoreductase subunit 4, partial [Cyanobacteriota bacterium]
MDASLPASLASAAETSPFPWLSLIVLLPMAVALVMPLLPGDPNDPRLPRTVALGALAVDLGLMLWVFARHFDGSLSGLQLVERVPWVPV